MLRRSIRDILSCRSKGYVKHPNEVRGGFYVNRTLSKRLMTGGGRRSRRNCYKSVRNLTAVVERYSTQLNGLERRYTLTQGALNDVTNRVVKTSAAVESSQRLDPRYCHLLLSLVGLLMGVDHRVDRGTSPPTF